MVGTVFDIKEFALNDGDGIRTTVFLKGCPLSCIWCHNPEGLSHHPELYVKKNGCKNCGLCKVQCTHEDCKPYGRCLHICPMDLIKVAGIEYNAYTLSRKLLSSDLIKEGGGITFSGGEPLLQGEFLLEALKILGKQVHKTIETSGYASHSLFKKIAAACDFVIMDIKLIDRELHRKYTGVYNDKIIKNALWLKNSKIPHLFRTPLIPGITDTDENLKAISELIGDDKIEFLPYNHLAPAKYGSVGKSFTDLIDETLCKTPDLTIFKNAVLRK